MQTVTLQHGADFILHPDTFQRNKFFRSQVARIVGKIKWLGRIIVKSLRNTDIGSMRTWNSCYPFIIDNLEGRFNL